MLCVIVEGVSIGSYRCLCISGASGMYISGESGS